MKRHSSKPTTANGAVQSGSDWYKLEPARMAFALIGKKPDEIAKWTMNFIEALATRQRGLNPLADSMMQERFDYVAQQSEYGKIGREKQLKSSGGARGVAGGAPAITDDTNDTDKTDLQPDPKPKAEQPPESDRLRIRTSVYESLNLSDRGRDGSKERIATMPNDDLAQFAADFCHESDPVRAVFAFKKIIRGIGHAAFRTELDAFVAEVEAGEEPRNRGAAFTARLKALVEARKARSA